MKVFVTGVNGQLGHDVANELAARGYECVVSGTSDGYRGMSDGSSATKLPYEKLDIADRTAVLELIGKVCPDVIINCAAWTAVDAAELPENEEKVRRANVFGPGNLALACKETGAKLIHISTEYVFDGNGTEPWKPDCTDYAPLNFYGRTKLEGELAVSKALERFFIVRISWAFGVNGSNFIRTMINAGRTHSEVRVVNDQIGTPTYTFDLAKLLADMCLSDRYGYYHAANSGGFISWYELCCEAYRQCRINTAVIPVSTDEYGNALALRPKNSRMDTGKLIENGFTLLPDWKDAVARYIKDAGFLDF